MKAIIKIDEDYFGVKNITSKKLKLIGLWKISPKADFSWATFFNTITKNFFVLNNKTGEIRGFEKTQKEAEDMAYDWAVKDRKNKEKFYAKTYNLNVISSLAQAAAELREVDKIWKEKNKIDINKVIFLSVKEFVDLLIKNNY